MADMVYTCSTLNEWQMNNQQVVVQLVPIPGQAVPQPFSTLIYTAGLCGITFLINGVRTFYPWSSVRELKTAT